MGTEFTYQLKRVYIIREKLSAVKVFVKVSEKQLFRLPQGRRKEASAANDPHQLACVLVEELGQIRDPHEACSQCFGAMSGNKVFSVMERMIKLCVRLKSHDDDTIGGLVLKILRV